MAWETVTHARLRAGQGDLTGARRIVGRLLRDDPTNAEALRLLEAIDGRADAEPAPPGDEGPLAEPVPGDPAVERARFRHALTLPDDREARRAARARLGRWLERLEGRS